MIFCLRPEEARYEVKFVANATDKARLLAWIRHHRAGFRVAYPDRLINNIYFDTHNYRALQENIAGVSQRGKLRYRWYGEGLIPGPGTLEYKIKHNCFGWKHLYPITDFPFTPQAKWSTICRGLKKILGKTEKLLLDAYPCPILINRYQRKYFISRDRRVRVTLDWDLKTFDQQKRLSPNLTKAKQTPDIIVIEFKGDRADRELLDQCIQNIPVRHSKHSKYVSGATF